MNTRIQLGISTCPNDTFAFHGILTGAVNTRGLAFEIELLDIEELNRGLFAGRFDVAKTSFHAALKLAGETVVLRVGSALGFGVGPLLLAARPGSEPSVQSQTTLCPGEHTTAALLFELFYPRTTRVEHVVFSQIMPQLVRQEAEFGVCIHEGRFTWQAQGLSLVADLGSRWEAETQAPLPLGGLVARRSLGTRTTRLVEAVILDSIQYAQANRDATLETMRRYAQEFDDEVLMQHVDLYVNDWTCDLGSIGGAALGKLSQRSRTLESLKDVSELEIFSS